MKQEQDLQNYIREMFEKNTNCTISDVKVDFTIPHQATVLVKVKDISSEITKLAEEMEKEFFEMDRHVRIHVVCESPPVSG
jgi:hypothetical protein